MSVLETNIYVVCSDHTLNKFNTLGRTECLSLINTTKNSHKFDKRSPLINAPFSKCSLNTERNHWTTWVFVKEFKAINKDIADGDIVLVDTCKLAIYDYCKYINIFRNIHVHNRFICKSLIARIIQVVFIPILIYTFHFYNKVNLFWTPGLPDGVHGNRPCPLVR